MSAPSFKPVYDTDVTVTTNMEGVASGVSTVLPVNPQYCLNADSAKELLTVLRAGFSMYLIALVEDYPTLNFGGWNHYSRKVPWMKMVNPGGGQNGADQVYSFNCGQFADYWASASMVAAGQYRDLEVAWRNVQMDVSVGLSYLG